jgi:hypothetical protein
MNYPADTLLEIQGAVRERSLQEFVICLGENCCMLLELCIGDACGTGNGLL